MSKRVAFTFEGRTVSAEEGQSIGAALHAAGVRTLSWSSKYRRPRGLRCVRGVCPSCTVRVDGLPGVLACTTPVRGGEVVERIRPAVPWFPADRLSRLAPAGFYYEHLARQPRLWRRAERLLARLAGQAEPPAPNAVATGGFQERSVDLLVVGAGRTGLTAAIEGARSGRSVLVVERDYVAGGRLLSEPNGRELAERLVAEVRATGAEVLLSAIDLGVDDDGVHGVVHPGGLIALHARDVRFATGTYDREIALPDGDRPGVMLASGVQRLLVRERVRPGTRAVIVEVAREGDPIARLLAAAGIEVVARCAPGEVRSIRGRPAVTAIQLARGRLRCDLVVVAAGSRPADELVRQADLTKRAV